MFGQPDVDDMPPWGSKPSEESLREDAEYWERERTERKLTIMLSTALRIIESKYSLKFIPKHIQEWWRDNKYWDDERIAREQKEAEDKAARKKMKDEALAKLTDEEKRVLGL